jgi:hypothetical protein
VTRWLAHRSSRQHVAAGVRVLILVLSLLGLLTSSAPAAVDRGHSGDGTARLAGRRLEVRLAAGLTAAHRALVTCGDAAGASEGRPIWASRTSRSIALAPHQRKVLVRFDRDVSERANLCEFVSQPEGSKASIPLSPAPGSRAPVCRAVGPERVVARSSEALLLALPGFTDDPYAKPRRACLLPRSRSRLLDIGYGGSSQGQFEPHGFVLNGHWAAWTASAFDRDTPPGPDGVLRQDLRKRNGPADTAEPRDFGLGVVTAIALAPSGAAVWTFDEDRVASGQSARSVVLAARPTATTATALTQGPVGSLTSPGINADATTASWMSPQGRTSAPLP